MAVGWEDSELFPEGLILKLERNAIASCWMKFKHISLCRLSPLFVHLKYIVLFIQQVTNKQDGKKNAGKLRNPYFHHIHQIGEQRNSPPKSTHWLGPGFEIGLIENFTYIREIQENIVLVMSTLIDIPGVAGAVLQTASSLIS